MYKFYTIPDIDTVDKIIGNKPSIKFSTASNLNDPFELKFNLKLDPFAVGHYEEFKKVHVGANYNDFKDWQEQVKDNEGFLWYTEQSNRMALSEMITLCSFTYNNKSNLMWSHYTNNHEGICVEYDNELSSYLRNTEGFLGSEDVKYSEEPPAVDYLEDGKTKILKMLFNKQIEWQYENEYRVVLLSRNEIDFIPIKTDLIKSVYIGARVKPDIESRILEICTLNKIPVYYGITLGKTYNVSFKERKASTFYNRNFWEGKTTANNGS